MSKLFVTKKKFFFGYRRCAFFFFKRTKSNLFLTLSDLNFCPIITKSTGLARLGNSKRKKLSTQALDNLIFDLNYFFKFHRIRRFIIILRSGLSRFINFLVGKLRSKGYFIHAIVIRKKLPHNGMRVRKMRRR